MINKAPAYQWYPKDILTSQRVAMMDLKEEGAYRRALDFCWLHGHIPSDPGDLSRLIGKGCTIKISEKILKMFSQCDEDHSKMIHDRLEEERRKQEDYKNRQSLNGRRGGRPKKEKNIKPNESQEKGLGFSGLSQTKAKKSSSSSTPVKNNNNYSFTEEETQKFNQFEKWINENTPRVSQMKEPFTIIQWKAIMEKYEGKVANVLKSMHNYEPLLKKNRSAYLTACNWLKKEIK